MDSRKGTTVLYEFPENNEAKPKSRTWFYYSLVLLVFATLAGTVIVVVYGKVMVKELSSISISVPSSGNIHSNSNFFPKTLNNEGTDSEKISKNKFSKAVWPEKTLTMEDELTDKVEDTSDEDFFNFETNPRETVKFNTVDFKLKPGTNVNAGCQQSAFDKEFVKTLPPHERNAVEKLKEKVTAKLWETFCDASSEYYLVRYLKDKKWDLGVAEEAILKTVAWRKKEKVDEVLTENFNYFENELPIFIDGKAYDGQIVISMDASSVDFRKITLAGKKDQLYRYFTRASERFMVLAREAQFRGENVTHAIVIENFEGFNVKQHGCNQCVTVLVDHFITFIEYYPGIYSHHFMVNVPSEIEMLIHLAMSVFPPEISNLFHIFGTNKIEWQKAVLEKVPANQIRPVFGGIMKTDSDGAIH